jgi:anaerobic magnesium-protoporphyrin IX monomethyl ester cyclase
MDVLLINPPYQTLTSNLGVGHQVPLGLLMVGGALIGAGHRVRLLDAECRRLSIDAVATRVRKMSPHVVMTGHAGSTPAHPICLRMLQRIKQLCPQVKTIYGGVYPTYHAKQLIESEPAVDFVVRGEGEATAVELLQTLENGGPDDVSRVRGLAFRGPGGAILTPERLSIANLDHYRVGWELIRNWNDYQCFGLGRAAIIQFSRGCPHRCTYCGQHGFWVKWRHRDPIKLADEVAFLHRVHGVRFITLADENPTTLRPLWKKLLEEIAARNLGVHFFATIRATDIVRDADLLPLYRKAGILYVLMGIESTSEEVLRQVRKGSTPRHDFQACRLLREHGIFSVMGHIVGLADETRASFRIALQQLLQYRGNYLNAMYVTPHDWTPFAAERSASPLIEPDQSKWDYRHQVLGQKHLSRRQIFWAVKWMELRYHLARLPEMLGSRDRFVQWQFLWTFTHIGLVWLGEIAEFVLRPQPREKRAYDRRQSATATISLPVMPDATVAPFQGKSDRNIGATPHAATRISCGFDNGSGGVDFSKGIDRRGELIEPAVL